MLKIATDPPDAVDLPLSIEALLLQTSEYLYCAITVAQQRVLLHPKSACQFMTLATMHGIEHTRTLVEMALTPVWMRGVTKSALSL